MEVAEVAWGRCDERVAADRDVFGLFFAAEEGIALVEGAESPLER